jgi:hypothetical protein
VAKLKAFISLLTLLSISHLSLAQQGSHERLKKELKLEAELFEPSRNPFIEINVEDDLPKRETDPTQLHDVLIYLPNVIRVFDEVRTNNKGTALLAEIGSSGSEKLKFSVAYNKPPAGSAEFYRHDNHEKGHDSEHGWIIRDESRRFPHVAASIVMFKDVPSAEQIDQMSLD